MTQAEQYILERIKQGKFTYDGNIGYVIKVGPYYVWVASGVGFVDYGKSHLELDTKPSLLTQYKIMRAYKQAKRNYKIRVTDYAEVQELKRLQRRIQAASQKKKVYRNE